MSVQLLIIARAITDHSTQFMHEDVSAITDHSTQFMHMYDRVPHELLEGRGGRDGNAPAAVEG